MFEITRLDGRSNQQVLIDFVREAPYGKEFTYEELEAVLGKSKENGLRAIIYAASNRLCSEYKRALVNVRGKGYRIAQAREHMAIAGWRKKRADRQMQAGLHVLRNVNWDQLDSNATQAHMGMLMIAEAQFTQMRAFDTRLSRVERAIRSAGISTQEKKDEKSTEESQVIEMVGK